MKPLPRLLLIAAIASLLLARNFPSQITVNFGAPDWRSLITAVPTEPTQPSTLFNFTDYALQITREMMQMLLTIVLAAASIIVISKKSYDPKDKHWAYATIGILIGFWLNAM